MLRKERNNDQEGLGSGEQVSRGMLGGGRKISYSCRPSQAVGDVT